MIKRVGVLALCMSLLQGASCYWYQLYSLYIYSVTLNKELRAKARYMLEKERERETTPSACARVPRVTWGVMVFVVH